MIPGMHASEKIEFQGGRCVRFSHKGDYVAAGGDSSFLFVIEVATGIVLSTLKGHQDTVLCVAWSPDDSLLVSGSRDQTVALWDVKTGGLVRTKEVEGIVTSVGFSYDGKMIACNFGIWDGALVDPVRKFGRDIYSLAWSPTRAELVLKCGSEEVVEMLDMKNGTSRELRSDQSRFIMGPVTYSLDHQGCIGKFLRRDHGPQCGNWPSPPRNLHLRSHGCLLFI